MLPPTFDAGAGANPPPPYQYRHPARRPGSAQARIHQPVNQIGYQVSKRIPLAEMNRRVPQVSGTHRLVFVDGRRSRVSDLGNGKFAAVAVLELPAVFPHVADTPTDSQHVIDTALEWIRRDRFRAPMRVDRGFPRRLRMQR